jgi:hypothetical protein
MRAFIAIALLVVGCNQAAKESAAIANRDLEKKIADNLAVLGDDQEAARSQRYCAVLTKNRLGAMGTPVKISLKDQNVFLCCEACQKEAEKDLDAVIKRVEQLHIQSSLEELPPDDRKLAEAQRYCASDGESPLGSMGKPTKIMVKGQPVFLCCEGCEKSVRQDEDKALALVKKLQADSGKK